MDEHQAIRLVAYFEACKGLLVLVAATGVLPLLHHDLHDLAASLIAHAHLNPAARYPAIFLEAASRLQDTRLLFLAAGAAASWLRAGLFTVNALVVALMLHALVHRRRQSKEADREPKNQATSVRFALATGQELTRQAPAEPPCPPQS